MTKIKNIQDLYKQLNHKGDFIKLVADDFGLSPLYVKNFWFCKSGYWSIPEKNQDRVVELLQNTIKNQK